MKAIPCLVLFVVLTSCATSNKTLIEAKARQRMTSLDQDSQDNINALIKMLDQQALVTSTGEKRWIPYEFRIPLDSRKKKRILRIDPSISFTPRTDTYQCIGENASREKVFRIVALPYTYKVKFCPYE